MSYPSDPELGWYYVVSVAGEVGGVQYGVGDWIVWNGTSWDRVIGKSDVSPVGEVRMYSGTGIANVEARTVQLGDEIGDSFAMPGWFVCNGLAGTPDLKKSFIRCDVVSGVVGGSDDAVVVSHDHNLNTGTGSGEIGQITVEYIWNQVPSTSRKTLSTGVSGVDENMPSFYSMIFVIKMS